jgi:carbon-monoxide dehydrogenase medium subunit
MKPAPFDYARPAGLAEALAALAPAAQGAEGLARGVRALAGGQSLGPMLNLRLADAARLVDVRRLPELRGHRLQEGRLLIGAAVTHAEIEDGVLPDTTAGMLSSVARTIAYRAVRNRGTLGGSLSHADPAADWVNCMLVLQASLHLQGPGGARAVAVADFFRGAYQTALQTGELLVAVELPPFSPQLRWGYYKVCAKVGEFAQAIGAVVVDPALQMCSLLVGAIEARPLLVPELAHLLDQPYEDARDAIARHLPAIWPGADEVAIHQHAVALARAMAQSRNRGRDEDPLA